MQHDSQKLAATILESMLVSAIKVRCALCGQTEFVAPFDSDTEPFDDTFVSSYVCTDCDVQGSSNN